MFDNLIDATLTELVASNLVDSVEYGFSNEMTDEPVVEGIE
jgi:hypothetical protein